MIVIQTLSTFLIVKGSLHSNPILLQLSHIHMIFVGFIGRQPQAIRVCLLSMICNNDLLDTKIEILSIPDFNIVQSSVVSTLCSKNSLMCT